MGKFDDLKAKKKKIDNFVNGAEEYQNKSTPNKEKEELERLNVEIPRSLHKSLKIKSATEDIKIREIVINALNDHLKK